MVLELRNALSGEGREAFLLSQNRKQMDSKSLKLLGDKYGLCIMWPQRERSSLRQYTAE